AERAHELAASFDKHKDKVREKNGVSKEKYKDVRSEPVVKQNLKDCSGVYEVQGLGDAITIQIENDGRIVARGHQTLNDGSQSRSFKLDHASISGALLTADKVYDNGATEKFEGVFLMRTERSSPSDVGVTTFGLGVVLNSPHERFGNTWDKLFYQRK